MASSYSWSEPGHWGDTVGWMDREMLYRYPGGLPIAPLRTMGTRVGNREDTPVPPVRSLHDLYTVTDIIFRRTSIPGDGEGQVLGMSPTKTPIESMQQCRTILIFGPGYRQYLWSSGKHGYVAVYSNEKELTHLSAGRWRHCSTKRPLGVTEEGSAHGIQCK